MRWDDASSPLDDWQLGEVAGAWNLSNDDNDEKNNYNNDDNDEKITTINIISLENLCARSASGRTSPMRWVTANQGGWSAFGNITNILISIFG